MSNEDRPRTTSLIKVSRAGLFLSRKSRTGQNVPQNVHALLQFDERTFCRKLRYLLNFKGSLTRSKFL